MTNSRTKHTSKLKLSQVFKQKFRNVWSFRNKQTNQFYSTLNQLSLNLFLHKNEISCRKLRTNKLWTWQKKRPKYRNQSTKEDERIVCRSANYIFFVRSVCGKKMANNDVLPSLIADIMKTFSFKMLSCSQNIFYSPYRRNTKRNCLLNINVFVYGWFLISCW